MRKLEADFLAYVGQTSPSPMMIPLERADGCWFWSPDGKRYFDLISGVSVSSVGHNNPDVVEAVRWQATRYMHVMVYGEMIESPQLDLARTLAGLLPENLGNVFFVNSGAEAVEGALKLAKRYTGRAEMLSFRNAYHGSTQGTMSMMAAPQYREAYGPLLPEVGYLDYNDFDGLSKISEKTACVLAEPVQGEGGVRLPARGFLAALRKRCDETGTLLIFDEIQTGLGRTGKMFAFENYGVVPDILCLAKALGGGMPLGAFISSGEIMRVLTRDPALGHITTFGGHPVCCAAGLAALRYVMNNCLAEKAEAKGAAYEAVLRDHPSVLEIRRSGLIMAVELGSPGKLYKIMDLFKEGGILSDWFLFCDTAFRISPPLTVTDEEIRESCDMILRCLDRL